MIGCRCKYSNVLSRAVLIVVQLYYRYHYSEVNLARLSIQFPGNTWIIENLIYGQYPSDDSGGVTPLTIPNRVVKLISAENTSGNPWEDRSSPGFCS